MRFPRLFHRLLNIQAFYGAATLAPARTADPNQTKRRADCFLRPYPHTVVGRRP